MKTVKINYACESDDFNREQNLIYDLLKINGYDVQISDDPDYIICARRNFFMVCMLELRGRVSQLRMRKP